jgi:ParB family chromosome partitioning protein
VQGPEVRRISPHALVVEDNIRSQVDLDRAFVNSIKLHGVIVPILAHPDQDGNIIVRDGQRRTLAAREADAEGRARLRRGRLRREAHPHHPAVHHQ